MDNSTAMNWEFYASKIYVAQDHGYTSWTVFYARFREIWMWFYSISMTREEHIKVHEALHKSLDKLLADFLRHTETAKLPSETTVLELMEWSYKQTLDPTGDS